MPIVCFGSPKGGTGRTTLTATVGVALQRLGWRVLAVDLDRQNALRLNFELPDELPGVVGSMVGGEWDSLAVRTPAGMSLIPFGTVAPADAMRFHTHIGQNPGWLRDRLSPFIAQRDLLILVDMPPGPSAVDLELDPIADLHLLVLLADAMSLALLPRLQRGEYLLALPSDRVAEIGYVVNQVDPRRQLCRDVLALSRDVLGDALYGIVHQDEGVAEAAACQLTVLDYAPDSVASNDILAIAERVHGILAPL